MSWIRPALADASSDWHAGWDSSQRQVDWNRSVCITDEDFVVVVSLNRNTSTRANFITCFRADNSIGRIRQTPSWPKT